MNNTELTQNVQPTMTSREIADLTSKRHDHVKSDIQKMVTELREGAAITSRPYQDSMNRRQVEYILGDREYSLLMEKYKGLARVPLALQEKAALAAIEQVLGVTLNRQYRVGIYRIDGYDAENNIAYEIDEHHHRRQRQKDAERQAFIERELGCKFVRVEV